MVIRIGARTVTGLRNDESSAKRAYELLGKHGFPARDLEPLQGGTVNEVWTTKQHVVRIGSATDHHREARLADAAVRVGVRSPNAVAWGEGYSIWPRLPGTSLQQARNVSRLVWQELLNDLERLHDQPLEPSPWSPPRNDTVGASRLIEQSNEHAQWTKLELDSLIGLLTLQRPQHKSAFIHGDAYAGNILVDERGAYLALIDWGCAGWASLEAECARLENDALEIAKRRWGDMLNVGLLELLRLEFLLQILIQGRVGTGAVREQLRIVAEFH